MQQVTTDPFSIVEQALWWAMDAHPVLAAMVKPGNTVRYCGANPKPAKDTAGSSDLPEIALIPSSDSLNKRASSGGTGIDLRFTLVMNTDDMRTVGGEGKRKGINQVRWAVYRALSMYRDGIPDLPFGCCKVAITDGLHKLDRYEGPDEQRDRGDGWVSVCQIEVWTDFTWEDIRL